MLRRICVTACILLTCLATFPAAGQTFPYAASDHIGVVTTFRAAQ